VSAASSMPMSASLAPGAYGSGVENFKRIAIGFDLDCFHNGIFSV
jgi:hypothetical protein